MRSFLLAALLAGGMLVAAPLAAQQVCPGLPYLVNTPEDELMLAYNGAENPQEQVAALDKFAQQHADSKFMPCVYELYTIAYLKQNDYAKAIEQGEKGFAAGRADVMLLLNLAKAYVSSGTASDTALEVLMKGPEAIQAESTPARPPNVSDDEWKKVQDEATEQAKDWQGYMEYTFFQLVPRMTDAKKRIAVLDKFPQAYPNSPNVGKLNLQYFLAYQMADDHAKATEYGEKAVAADPNSIETLNGVADYYATTLQTELEKAETYAKKVLELAPGLKKPEGTSDEQFKSYVDAQLGVAHATLGYVAFVRGSNAHRVAPAIQEFKTAIDLLASNPALQGRILYYLGFANERLSPANHKGAIDALTRAAALPSPWQGAAQELLEKVKKAAGQ